MNQMEFMTEVLFDWCTLENKEFISADDLLFTDDTGNSFPVYNRFCRFNIFDPSSNFNFLL